MAEAFFGEIPKLLISKEDIESVKQRIDQNLNIKKSLFQDIEQSSQVFSTRKGASE